MQEVEKSNNIERLLNNNLIFISFDMIFPQYVDNYYMSIWSIDKIIEQKKIRQKNFFTPNTLWISFLCCWLCGNGRHVHPSCIIINRNYVDDFPFVLCLFR